MRRQKRNWCEGLLAWLRWPDDRKIDQAPELLACAMEIRLDPEPSQPLLLLITADTLSPLAPLQAIAGCRHFYRYFMTAA